MLENVLIEAVYRTPPASFLEAQSAPQFSVSIRLHPFAMIQEVPTTFLAGETHRMDADLLSEIERLQKIYDEKGLYDFLCECQDCWLAVVKNLWPRSPLFELCSPDGKLRTRRDGKPLGCPFSIRSSDLYRSPRLFAWTDDWTTAIRNDVRIPLNEARMRPHSVMVLAEWQQTFRDYFRGRKQIARRQNRMRKQFLKSVAEK